VPASRVICTFITHPPFLPSNTVIIYKNKNIREKRLPCASCLTIFLIVIEARNQKYPAG
jgi:hypothetical protein